MFFQLLLYSLCLWLGLYLLARRTEQTALRLAGLGLAAYALALASDWLRQATDSSQFILAAWFTHLHWVFVFWPAFFWSGALAYQLPEASPWRQRLTWAWRWGLAPLALVFSALALLSPFVVSLSNDGPQPGPLYWVWVVVVLGPLLVSAGLLARQSLVGRARRPYVVLLVAALFFAMSIGLVLFPLNWWPRVWTLFLLDLDLGFLGLTIAVLDAFEEGESLLPDLMRSLAASALMALAFGGLVALTAALGPGWTLAMQALLMATLTLAIAAQVFQAPLQAALDRVVFARLPRLRQARAELREVAEALPRADPTLDPLSLDEAEFARLTRRALSHLGNLPRLAASPLTQLPILQQRLAQRRADGNALERAVELKALLTESIQQLKPDGPGDFGVSDEWRHYNALYFPYVVGLKPYARRTEDGLTSEARAALDWFQTAVPERTLHNWQAAAARLVAQDLRERHKSLNWQ